MHSKNSEKFKFCLEAGLFGHVKLNKNGYFTCNVNGKDLKLKGLCKQLKKCFYPNSKLNYTKRKNGVKKRETKFGGMMLGLQVHDQLKIFANSKSFEEFKKNIYKDYVDVDPYFMKALKWLKENNLKPLFSELPVCDIDTMIGTAVDMICENKKGELIAIEWKTGMDNCFSEHKNVRLNIPFFNLFDCPRDHAFLQLAMTCFFLRKEFKLPISKAYVVHIYTNNCNGYELDKDFISDNFEYVYNMLSSFNF